MLGVGCIKFIFPEVAPLRSAHERIHILTPASCAHSELGILNRTIHQTGIASGRIRVYIGVVAWTWFIIFDLGILAVGDFGEEDALLLLSMEGLFFFRRLWLVIAARSRVLSRRILLVFDVNGGFKYFSILLRRLEVTDWSSSFVSMLVWIVQSWANCIVTTASVHVGVYLFAWD